MTAVWTREIKTEMNTPQHGSNEHLNTTIVKNKFTLIKTTHDNGCLVIMPWIVNLMKRSDEELVLLSSAGVRWLSPEGTHTHTEALQTNTSPCVTAIPLPSHSFIHCIRRIASLCVGLLFLTLCYILYYVTCTCNSGKQEQNTFCSHSHTAGRQLFS